MLLSEPIQFETLRNMRDLGGMQTADGRIIRKGRLFRSGQLSDLCKEDEEKLYEMVEVIADLRTDGERFERPDANLPGVQYHQFPVLDSMTMGITGEKSTRQLFGRLIISPEEAKEYMCTMYSNFALLKEIGMQYSLFVRLLLEEHKKGILWHCTAGKDRAGIAAVLVEEILGIPRDTIIADYLSTNEYLEEDIRNMSDFVKSMANTQDPAMDDALRYLFGAEQEFIEAYYKSIDTQYGGMKQYLREVIRLEDSDSDRLKQMYLI